jgi:GNAT superfamily N-acetyltransferase
MVSHLPFIVPDAAHPMDLHLITPRLFLAYVPDVDTLEWVGGGRCGVYYLSFEAQTVGAVSLTSCSRAHGEIGYKIEPEFRGLGFATEAVQAVIDHAADHHGFTMLVAQARADNVASRRVLEKSGFALACSKLCWSEDFDAPVEMTSYRRAAPEPGALCEGGGS